MVTRIRRLGPGGGRGSINVVSFALTFLQIGVIAASMLGAFHQRRRLTLIPLCVIVGAMQYLQTIAVATIYVPLPLTSGLAVSPGSMAMFAASLFAVLLVYVTEDIPTTRAMIYGVIAANIVLTALSVLITAQLSAGAINLLGVPRAVFELNSRVYLAGTATLLADTYLLVITYEFLNTRWARSPLVLRIVGALGVTLSFDAVVFCSLAFIESPQFGAILAGNLLGKAIAAVVFGVTLTGYIQFVHRTTDLPAGAEPLRDVFSILTYRQKYEAVREQNMALANANAEIHRLYGVAAEQGARLAAILASSRDGIVMVSLDRRILFLNEAAQRLMALKGSTADWIGRHWREAVAGLAAPAAVQLSAAEERRVVQGDEASSEGEITLGERTIAWANLPVRAEGLVEGRLIVLREVTSERQLALLREEVGHMMVHDLRSPLTALSGSLRLLKSDAALDEDGSALAGAAESSAAKMLTLVNGLLDLYKLESGLPDLRRSPVSLRDLVRAQLEGLQTNARAAGVVLDEQVPEDLVIDVDAELIGRVIQNLVANAISYARAGSAVRIEGGADGDGVRLAVTDRGTGVAAAIQPRLFQKFASTRKGGGGTGLGLAFCRLAIEAHGGRIWYEPAEPTGSTFQFVIANPVAVGPRSIPVEAS